MRKALLFLILLALLAGCTSVFGSQEPIDPVVNDLPPRNPAIGPDPITLEIWLDLDFTRDNTLFNEMVAEFEKVYPQVDVNISSFVRESMPQKVKLAVQSGIPPNVVQGHVYAMAGQSLAEPLNQEWAAWESLSPDAKTQFLPSAMQETVWQDDYYGVPLDVYTLVLLYNRNHFDEAGLDYPEGNYDFSYLQEAADVLTQPENERFALGFTTDPWYVFAWITGAGGNLLTGDPGTGFNLTLNSQTNADALAFLTQMIENGYGPRPSSRPRDYEDVREKFLRGEISMYFGESQDIHLIQSTNPDFPLGVAELPITPARESAASVLGSSGLFIPRGARHKEAAFELMKWASSDRYAYPMARRLGRYPAKTWLQTSPEFTENLSLIPFFNQLNNARPYRLDLFPTAEEAFTDAIKASFYNIAVPAEALEQAQQIGQESMAGAAP
jgi:ABC-type glycerol-3-phosphate transport system substrate-binding protein